jgi:hypothetical protein
MVNVNAIFVQFQGWGPEYNLWIPKDSDRIAE